MMRVLLASIDSKYIHSNLAVRSMKLYAEKKFRLVRKTGVDIGSMEILHKSEDNIDGTCDDVTIDIAEYTINQPIQKILSGIYKHDADVIMLSCYIWNRAFMERLLHNLAVVRPDAEIWLGGPEVSFDGEKILEEFNNVRGIMLGEGEEIFSEILELYIKGYNGISKDFGFNIRHDIRISSKKAMCINRNYGKKQYTEHPEKISGCCLNVNDVSASSDINDFEKVDGIIFRNAAGKIMHTPQREPLDMNELPFVYEEIKNFENRIIYYESSRGCPFRCSYCLSSVDKKLRFRSLDKVKRELKFFLDNNVPQVKFVDRTFNCDHDRTMEIWRFLKENDNGITNFHFEMAADILRDDELELLGSLRCGQVQLEIGVQTTNSRTLAAIERPMDFDRLCRNVTALKKTENIHIHLDLIAGLPYEDMESFKKSFNDVFALRPEQLQLGFLKVLKGSPMADRAVSYGLKYTPEPPYEVLETKWILYDRLLELKQVEEMVEVYYNSGQFSNTLELLLESFESAFEMFGALGKWYEKNGLELLNLSRNSRYEKLLEFADEIIKDTATENAAHADTASDKAGENKVGLTATQDWQTELKRRITLDYYLRENVKTRPAFLGEETADKTFTKEFYSRESREHKYLTSPQLAQINDPRILRKHTHIEKTTTGYLLFDYTTRNPLTNNAAVILL